VGKGIFSLQWLALALEYVCSKSGNITFEFSKLNHKKINLQKFDALKKVKKTQQIDFILVVFYCFLMARTI